ncbi:G-protein coupled receptor GRL101-like [Saccostrea echinata]|uniref:G-protein coupled receptor GRL101-like n=1 Tax=Saccostrea echinata TaxID=191078 RepID=UPI002A80FDCA|nr:G-protein coupled receptor GRL101-like [Saccostrea echinata]
MGIFSELESLEKLYIQNNKIVSVEGMFAGLFSLKFLQVDFFSICCAKPRNYYDVTCVAPQNEISSCEQLISVPVLNVIIWYIAQLATFGNLIALIYNIISFSSGSSFTYFFLSSNLSLADLLMGVYLYIIAVVNLIHTGRYGFEDHKWRQSFLCTFEGVLATLSSEASVLFVFLITIDRVTSIKHPFSQRKKVWYFGAALFSWIIAISLSLFPVLPLNLPLFDGFYSQSPICISLPLSVRRQPGWQYSMVIFIGFNFTLFLGILFGHFIILFDVLKSGRVIQTSNTHVREITLAKSVVAVVMTDLLCWIPIGIIGMLTFSGIDVSREVYAWIIVLVLPINSAINPILYTLSGVIRDRRRRKVNETTFQKEKKLLEQEIVRLKRRLDSSKRLEKNGWKTKIKLYDKRDDSNFSTLNFPCFRIDDALLATDDKGKLTT